MGKKYKDKANILGQFQLVQSVLEPAQWVGNNEYSGNEKTRRYQKCCPALGPRKDRVWNFGY